MVKHSLFLSFVFASIVIFQGCNGSSTIDDFDLDFGPWESIFYGEFDGQRDKRIMIKVIGD